MYVIYRTISIFIFFLYLFILHLFRRKTFSVFFGVWCNRKWWFTEIIFNLTKKSLLNFLKTIYDFKNRKSFFEFKLFIIACTFIGICHHWTLEFVGGPNLRWRFPNFGIRAPESDVTGCRISATIVEIFLYSGHYSWNPPKFGQPVQETGHLRQILVLSLESGNSIRILVNLTRIWSVKLNFGQFRRNLATLCQILAHMAEILPVGNRI
jgi:hypothetical protein